MTFEMQSAVPLDTYLEEETVWKERVEYSNLNRISEEKSTAKKVYVEEPSDDKPLSLRAINTFIQFCHYPNETLAFFRREYPSLTERYVDSKDNLDRLEVERFKDGAGNDAIMMHRLSLVPFAQILNILDSRNCSEDTVRRYYIEPFSHIVKENPTSLINIAYPKVGGKSYYVTYEEAEPNRVVFSEEEQSEATNW